MTHDEWLAEVFRRIKDNEGCVNHRYYDSQGIPTIGVGFNLNRDDAATALRQCGIQDTNGIFAGTQTLTDEQIQQLFEYSFAPIEQQARSSLYPGVFDALTDARRFVICDLVFNLGYEGWMEFGQTRQLISHAQHQKDLGNMDDAHQSFEAAANHLASSAWASQVGERATRDIAMLRSGVWI